MNAYRALIVCLFGTFALLLSTNATRAQSTEPPSTDPGAIAERCIAHITQVTDRAVEHIANHGETGAARVAELVEAGQVRKAVYVAREFAEHIKLDAYRAARKITVPAYRCTKTLVRMGEFELAAEVDAAAREQLGRVKEARRAALDAIKGALPDRTSAAVE